MGVINFIHMEVNRHDSTAYLEIFYYNYSVYYININTIFISNIMRIIWRAFDIYRADNQ